MKHRLHFKLIGLLIAVALIGLVIFQSYWLMGLYSTLHHQMENDIKEALKIADYKELLFRMDEKKKKDGNADFSDTIQLGSESEDTESEQKKVNSMTIDDSDMSVDLSERDLKQEVDTALHELLTAVGQMEGMILQAMHNQLDSVISVNYLRYDSLLTAELRQRNINARYQLTLVSQINDEHTVYRILGKNHPGMESDTTAAVLDWKNAFYYDYPITLHPYYEKDKVKSETPLYYSPSTYRLYLKSPARIVLYQMLGIILSSCLVFIIIIATFIYLLRTILRQKTEEELKTDFTNNMTHELKTPISVSYAAVDSLLNFGEPVSDKQKKYLSIVKEQLTHLTGLVEQILSLSVENRSTFRLRPEQIHIEELLNNVIEQSKLKAGKEVQFHVDIPKGLTITADRTHFYNMVNNLVENAIKYADKKPVIVTIQGQEKDKEIYLTIEDNGPGISMAHQNRIFDKFYRIPSGNLHNVKGHGLGLYYVKDMMNKHGGDITVESTIQKGSRFTLHFKNK